MELRASAQRRDLSVELRSQLFQQDLSGVIRMAIAAIRLRLQVIRKVQPANRGKLRYILLAHLIFDLHISRVLLVEQFLIAVGYPI